MLFLISFTATSGTSSPQTLPSTSTPNAVAALWWADLAQANGSSSAAASPGKIFWELGGTYPDRFFTAYWVSYQHYSTTFPTGTVTGHIRVFENGNRVELVCDTCSGNGTIAHTQGVENGAGSSAVTVTGRNNAATATVSNDRQSIVVNSGAGSFCE